MALTLKNKNFNVVIIHETKEYQGVSSWLNEDYSSLPHQEIEGQNLAISPEDFVVIPELYGHVMEQLAKFPCGKIVLCQSYDYILETLAPGVSWTQYGFFKCLTTTKKQQEYIETVMRQSSFDIIKPLITDSFYPKNVPPMPIIGIHTKNQEDTINIIKTFYLKFPQYRWFTFRDLRGLSEIEFANSLKDCFVSVWVDNESGFGTFPLESMKCNVPVIGKVPNLPPSWMNEDNGIWITDQTLLADVVADFIQNWLEDNIKPEVYEEMKKTSQEFSDKQKFESTVVTLFEGYLNTRADAFEQQITKTEE